MKQEDKSTIKLQPYFDSKLANAVYASKLGQSLKGSGVTTYSLHPGVVATDIWKVVPWPFRGLLKIFFLSEEQGAFTQLYCSLEHSLSNETGLYYDDCKAVTVNPLVKDQEYLDQLYEQSLLMVQPWL